MTKTDLIFPAFSSRFVDFAVQFCFRCKFSFNEKRRSSLARARFDVRICHPIADSYKELSPKQIYELHGDEKKRKYASRIREIENGSFTPLVFTTSSLFIFLAYSLRLLGICIILTEFHARRIPGTKTDHS